MDHHLVSSPDFIIRSLATTAEIDALVLLTAQTFRSDENLQVVASQRQRYLARDPDFHPDQLRGAFISNTLLGGYILRERSLSLGPTRLRTGCIGGVVTYPDYRHQGIASAMMQEAITYASSHQYALLLLHGIPNFYSQFGFSDCLEDTPVHSVDRKLIPEQSSSCIVRSATIDDAPALLALYQLHYSPYLGSFAPTRTLQRQEHLLRSWFQENLPLVALDANNELQGYLLLSRRSHRLYAYEVAINTWPAALALLQYHSSLLDAESEAPDEVSWPLPLNSSSYYLLADHFALRSEMRSSPDSGWMARPGHLPTLLQSLQLLWQTSISNWFGTFALNIDSYTCFIELATTGISISDRPLAFTYSVHLSSQVFTQLLFGHRPITWAAGQLGQHIPDKLLVVLGMLFPSSPGCIAGSDYF